mmetsp:Transcript_5264/g.11726  ORF Transcript_5264/g.11726 Transcript_5264/m.11726 type:complete len:105 (+) Transcript_5264:3250-3564(+)
MIDTDMVGIFPLPSPLPPSPPPLLVVVRAVLLLPSLSLPPTVSQVGIAVEDASPAPSFAGEAELAVVVAVAEEDGGWVVDEAEVEGDDEGAGKVEEGGGIRVAG